MVSRRLSPLQLAPVLVWLAACSGIPSLFPNSREQVGRHGDHQVTPVNQTLTPYGSFVDLPGLRPIVLALTRDGRRLLVSGKTNDLWVLDAKSLRILQKVPLPNDRQQAPPTASARILEPDRSDQASYTGLELSADGSRAYLSDVSGSIKVFSIDEREVRASYSIPLPRANAPGRAAEIPSGLSLSGGGNTLYVCGNLSNRLLELDVATGALRRAFPVGTAPYAVVLAGKLAFVSNWGGARPSGADVTGPAGRGTRVKVDPVRFIASEGSVTVVDLERGQVLTETRTGLHASALAVSPDGKFVICANSAQDDLSVLDARSGALVASICCKSSPAELLAASPNALAFSRDGRRLFVANGTQNAVAVVEFDPSGHGRLSGLVPVGWFPSAIAVGGDGRVFAANLKGLSPGRPREGGGDPEFNSHQYHGSLSSFLVPGADELARLSAVVERNSRADATRTAFLPPRPDAPVRAIPERIGEPSAIEHVVYVIKENRTYDQVLGDMPEGDGDPRLCVFAEKITPNQHALARQFVLLDNTYCPGILSADGHQWSTTAFATDYMEKSFAGFPRSYPDGMGEDEKDALAYAPSGFLWDAAIERGLSIRNFGEFCKPTVSYADPARRGHPSFAECLEAWRSGGGTVRFSCEPVIESLIPCSVPDTVGWDMDVPDQYRADLFLRELAACERRGEFPRLTIVCLPRDHTNGTAAGRATPESCVADNDLALGRILEGLGRSPFWARMAVFVIEDDPQNGWDHVSGYRTTAFVASPFARRGVRVSTRYNTTSILRTIEQILGIPPRNQFDASATPMSDCFTDEPDFSPFVCLPVAVPLDQVNPEASAIADPVLRADALLSAAIDFSAPDRAPEDLLNRILWRGIKGPDAPFPEWAVTSTEDE
ncbi:MAG: alkaline phosphatase family protein [Planctomycetota bacterium]